MSSIFVFENEVIRLLNLDIIYQNMTEPEQITFIEDILDDTEHGRIFGKYYYDINLLRNETRRKILYRRLAAVVVRYHIIIRNREQRANRQFLDPHPPIRDRAMHKMLDYIENTTHEQLKKEEFGEGGEEELDR